MHTPTARHDPDQLGHILSLSGLGAWQFDHVEQRLLASPSVLALMRGQPHASDSLTTHVWQGLVHEADWPRVLSLLATPAEQGHAAIRFRVMGPHGTWRWLEAKGGVQARDAHGNPRLSAGVVTDVSDRVRADAHHNLQLVFLSALLRNILLRGKNRMINIRFLILARLTQEKSNY